MLTVRSAGQRRDSLMAHHTEGDTSPGERAVRHTVRHRVVQERAFDAAQREDDDDFNTGYGGGTAGGGPQRGLCWAPSQFQHTQIH